MHVKKTLLAAGVATTIGLAGIAGVGVASAATNTDSSGDGGGISSLVTKLADRFNVSESDVQAVFDENRAEMEANHQAALEEKIAAAVTDGTITQEQADAILAKHKEMQAQRKAMKSSLKDMTAEERQAAKAEMEAKHTEMRQWAEDNGLSEETLRDLLMVKMVHGPGPGLAVDGGDHIRVHKFQHEANTN